MASQMFSSIGVKKVRKDVFPELQHAAFWWIEAVAKDAMVYMDHAKRITVFHMDVIKAMKRQSREVFIFCK